MKNSYLIFFIHGEWRKNRKSLCIFTYTGDWNITTTTQLCYFNILALFTFCLLQHTSNVEWHRLKLRLTRVFGVHSSIRIPSFFFVQPLWCYTSNCLYLTAPMEKVDLIEGDSAPNAPSKLLEKVDMKVGQCSFCIIFYNYSEWVHILVLIPRRTFSFTYIPSFLIKGR